MDFVDAVERRALPLASAKQGDWQVDSLSDNAGGSRHKGAIWRPSDTPTPGLH